MPRADARKLIGKRVKIVDGYLVGTYGTVDGQSPYNAEMLTMTIEPHGLPRNVSPDDVMPAPARRVKKTPVLKRKKVKRK